jgi:hypothetical protein
MHALSIHPAMHCQFMLPCCSLVVCFHAAYTFTAKACQLNNLRSFKPLGNWLASDKQHVMQSFKMTVKCDIEPFKPLSL